MSKKYKLDVFVRQEVELSVNEYVGKRILQLRKEKFWNQEELSKRTKISRSSISNIEIGRHALTMANLEVFCSVFGVKSKELLPF